VPAGTWRRNGGNLNDLGPNFTWARRNRPADDPAVAEELLDLARVRRRPDVEVLRLPTEQEVADAAADEVGREMMMVHGR